MKKAFGFVAVTTFLFCTSAAFAHPTNDNFANRTTLTGLNVNWSGTIAGTTIEPGEPPRGSFAPTASVWYAWSAPLNGDVEIGFYFVEFFAVFGVYRGTNLNDLVAVTNGVATGTARFHAQAGETYSIAVDSGYGQTDVFQMALTLTPVPPNDDFAKATRANGRSGWLQGWNASASVEPGEPHHAGTNSAFGKSIWWRWTASDHGMWQLNLSRLATNTAFAIYTGGSVSNLTLLASNRSFFGAPVTALSVRVAAGGEYFIAADHTNDVLMDFSFSFSPAPVNDYFTNRLVLTGNTGAVVATTVDASVEPGEPSVSFAPPQTLWWTWTAPTTSPATFQFSDQSHMLEAYTNNALGSLQTLSGLDFLFQGFGRYVMPNARGGGTYQFRLRPGSVAGPFSFVWHQSSALASNNHLANRQQLAGTNITVSGGLSGATREAGEPSHGATSGGSSVWYGWRAPANGVVRFTLTNSSFNVIAACYRGTSYGALTTLASDINARGIPDDATDAFSVVAGVDYSIAVDSFISSDTFNFTMIFSPAPANDNFANRIVLPGTDITTTGTTSGAGKETGEPNHAGSTTRTGTIWWAWQAPSSGPVTVVAEGGPIDPVLAIYTGTQVAGLVPIASNNDYLQNGVRDSRVTFTAMAGTNYHIAVATTPLAAGEITLRIRLGVPPTVSWLEPTNDLVLALGSNVEFVADASDGDGTVTQVTFQVATTITTVSTFTSPPYKLALTNLQYGTYAYRAYAVDDDGLIGMSTQRQVRVPPLNDYFSNRFTIPENTVSVTGTMSGVTRDANEPRQLAGASRIAWWTWLAQTNGTAHLAITNVNGGSRAVSVYYGPDLGALTLVATSSGGSRATFEVESGTQYHIAAETTTDGEVVISFINPIIVGNDRFTNAAVIAGTNQVINTSNAEATAEPGEPRHGGWDAGRSLWWTWTAPTNGVVALRTAGSSFGTTLGVYTGNVVSNLTLVVSNRTSFFSGNSAASFTAIAGTTYRIAVDGYFGEFGNVVLSFEFFNPPANDMFAQRIPLIGQTNIVSGNNTPATRENGEPSVFFGVNKTLWWTWTAPMSGRVIVSTEGSTVRNTLDIYTGNSLSFLTSVASAASFNSSNNVVQFDATAGTAYQIQLDSQSTPGGELFLRVMQPDSAANDNFAQRFALSSYATNVSGHNFNATREAGEPLHDLSQHRTVWWSWVAPETRGVSIVPRGTDTPKIAVYAGNSFAALSLMGTNYPDGLVAGAVTFSAVAGTEYQLAFFLRQSGMGEFQFSIVPNEPPVVQLLAPLPGAAFHPGENFVLSANASDAGGSVSNVQLLAGPFSRTDSTPPYSVIASNIPLGDYTATARATDNLGAFTMSPPVAFRIAPPNDDFADAAILPVHFTQIIATNIGAAKQTGEPNHALENGGRSIWFSWTAPLSARFSLSTEGSSVDTLLAVYTGDALSNLNAVAQSDERNAFDTWSELQFSARAGTNYFIAVDGKAGVTGTILLTLHRIADNDLFDDAITLSGHTTTSARNSGAALEADEPFHGSLPAGGSLWWTWTPLLSGRYMAVTAGSDFDTVLAVYSGQALSNLTLVAVDDDGAGRQRSVARFDAAAGEEYYIAVSGYGVARGVIQLAIATNGAPTLFSPGLGGTNFIFRTLSEPGRTNIAQRSLNFSVWTSFDSKMANDWWTDFRDPFPATNSIQVYRVIQP